MLDVDLREAKAPEQWKSESPTRRRRARGATVKRTERKSID